MVTPIAGTSATNGKQAVVAAQHIAKASTGYPKCERARDAARWIRGELQVEPTLKLAAETFGVSVPLVAQAREQLERRASGKHHGNGGTTTLSDSAIDNIVREVGVNRIWASIDRLTQPSLPFAIAALELKVIGRGGYPLRARRRSDIGFGPLRPIGRLRFAWKTNLFLQEAARRSQNFDVS